LRGPAYGPMTSESDIYRAANLVLDQQGEDTATYAADVFIGRPALSGRIHERRRRPDLVGAIY
jgi:hypothetical protein